ncbi:right-handed parallel beta-helix repeat-containing protein [Pedobacter segetis]|nr:right-handed parallel beta-helix repeat-containing protein [Pedobacter segetis]
MLNSIFERKQQKMTFSVLLLTLCTSFLGCKKEEVIIDKKILSTAAISQSMLLNSPYKAGSDITSLLQSDVNQENEILIPEGTYYISKPITKTNGTINIKSDGAILQMVPSFPSGKKNLSAGFILTGLSNISIDGLTIDGNRDNLLNAGKNWTNYIMGIQILASSNISIKNCDIINAPSISFNILNSSNIELVNCSSVNGMFHGIVFQNCTNAIASRSKVIGIGNQGNDVRKGGIGMLGIGGDHLSFTDNDIENTSDTGTKTEGSNFVTWSGNTLKNCGKDGIKFQNLIAGENPGVEANLDFVTDAKIMNNTIDQIYNGRNDGSSLIQVWNAHNVEVTGNLITGGSKTGQEDGICIWSDTDINAKYITVSGNTIKNTNRFIYLSKVSNATITENNCENLVAPKTKYDGFTAEYSDKISVTNNLFRRSATGAIDGFAAKMYESANFELQNNKLENAYNALELSFVSSDSSSVSNNQMDNFSSYAISVYSTTTGTVLNSLKLMGNTLSRAGMATGYSAVIRVDPTNLSIDDLDLSNTKIIGNARFGDVGLEVKSDLKKVNTLNLTGFSVTGNVFYPASVDLTACKTILK